MTTDRPLFIGLSPTGVEADSATYLSNYNFPERRLIVWDAGSLISEIKGKTGRELDDASYFHEASPVTSQLINSQRSILKFLEHGGDLVVIACKLCRFEYFNERGTAQNLNLDDYGVLGLMEAKVGHGSNVRYSGPAEASQLANEVVDFLDYSAVLSGSKLSPLFVVPNSGDMVGGYVTTNWGGCIAFVPTFSAALLMTQAQLNQYKTYQKVLINLPSQLRKTRSANSQPTWATGYMLPVEARAKARIAELEEEISSAQNQIANESTVINNVESRKSLFTGTGDSFEAAVLDALRRVGIDAVAGPKGHCDVIGKYKDVLFAVEAKGLKRGAKPGNANQCMRWVSDIQSALSVAPDDRDEIIQKYAKILAELGVELPGDQDEDFVTNFEVKGVLIINSHYDTPLSERDNPSEPTFNSQVLSIADRHSLCAISGLQLLCMTLACDSSKESQTAIPEALKRHSGEYTEYQDWQAYLQVPSSLTDDASLEDKGGGGN